MKFRLVLLTALLALVGVLAYVRMDRGKRGRELPESPEAYLQPPTVGSYRAEGQLPEGSFNPVPPG